MLPFFQIYFGNLIHFCVCTLWKVTYICQRENVCRSISEANSHNEPTFERSHIFQNTILCICLGFGIKYFSYFCTVVFKFLQININSIISFLYELIIWKVIASMQLFSLVIGNSYPFDLSRRLMAFRRQFFLWDVVGHGLWAFLFWTEVLYHWTPHFYHALRCRLLLGPIYHLHVMISDA